MDIDFEELTKGKGKRLASQSPVALRNPDKKIKDTLQKVNALSLDEHVSGTPSPSHQSYQGTRQGINSDTDEA
jgi:hypothetical protein